MIEAGANTPVESGCPTVRTIDAAAGQWLQDIVFVEACATCPACAGLDVRSGVQGRAMMRCTFERATPMPSGSARPVGMALSPFASAVRVGALTLGHLPAPYGSPVAIVDDDMRLVGVFERDGSIRPTTASWP